MSDSYVCVDASFLVKLVVTEPYSEQADALWASWIHDDIQPVAPRLLYYELTAVLRKKNYQKFLTDSEADAALAQALVFEIELHDPDDLHIHAWALARRFNQPTAYDSHYLALAESLGCPFWTGDKRLFNAIQHKLDWIYCLGNSPG